MNIGKILTLIIFCFSTIVFAAEDMPTNSDYAKEKRWAEQISDSLLDGEEVFLKNAGKEFLSLYTESENDTNKVIIVLHGLGVHPNDQRVIRPLRVGLSERGWHTLSVQLPILANGMEFDKYMLLLDEADSRIAKAMTWVKEQNKEVFAIVAHSLGTVMSTHFLTNNPNTQIKKYVGIGMPKFTTKYIKNVKIPFLDLYGSDDIEPVLTSVNERKTAGKNNKNYTQIKKDGADHFFTDKDDTLVTIVSNWLQNN